MVAIGYTEIKGRVPPKKEVYGVATFLEYPSLIPRKLL